MASTLIYTDLHLHSHKKNYARLQDCLNVQKWVFETAVESKCSRIIFLGDLFHERSKIDTLNYLRTFELFLQFASDHPEINIWLLVGNHDMYHKERWDVNSIKPLTAISNVHIVDKPQTIIFDGVEVDFLPHTESPLKELDKLRRPNNHLLLAHMAVHGAKLNTLHGTTSDVLVEYDDGMVTVGPEVFDSWKMTLLGHYHGAQHLNDKVEYVGSPLQLTFGEAFQEKHIMILDLKTLKKKYVVNDFSPKHLIIPQSQAHTYDMENNFVRVVVENTDSKNLVDLKKEYGDKAATLDFKVKEKKQEDAEFEIEDAKSILKSDDMLRDYMKVTGTPPNLDFDRLLNFGEQIVSES